MLQLHQIAAQPRGSCLPHKGIGPGRCLGISIMRPRSRAEQHIQHPRHSSPCVKSTLGGKDTLARLPLSNEEVGIQPILAQSGMLHNLRSNGILQPTCHLTLHEMPYSALCYAVVGHCLVWLSA